MRRRSDADGTAARDATEWKCANGANDMRHDRDRRTQKDRSESMQLRLLEATLACIGRGGYASVTLNDVAEEAQVSRGAIAHHYASKLDLTAAAMEHFFSARYDRLMSALADHAELSLEERLDILKEEFEGLFPVGFEIIIALRTDADLRSKYETLTEGRTEEMTEGYERMFPEFARAESPRLLIGVVASFYRGLFIDSFPIDRERIEKMADIVKDILVTYVRQRLI